MNLQRSLIKWKAIMLGRGKPSRETIDRELAARARKKCPDTTYIGITGSMGKSTCSALLSWLLAGQYRVAGSLLHNAPKDVMQRLSEMRKEADVAVFELSGHAPGILQQSCGVLVPAAGIVTAVSNDHFSNFRSKEKIAEEKSVLPRSLSADGLLLLNLDDPYVAAMREQTAARVVTFGESSEASYRAEQVSLNGSQGLSFVCCHAGERIQISLPVAAQHFLPAALAAVACAHQLGLPWSIIVQRAKYFEGLFGRCSRALISQQRLVIHDTIKAPYTTIEAAFKVLQPYASAPRRTIVLGNFSDYRGSYSSKARLLVKMGLSYADRVWLYRQPAKFRLPTEVSSDSVVFFDSLAEIESAFQQDLLAGEVILLKGSISHGLNTLFSEEIAVATVGAAVGCTLIDQEWSQFRASEPSMKEGLVWYGKRIRRANTAQPNNNRASL